MNTTQVIMLIAPGVLGYFYFVLTAKSDGQVNRRANLFSGLIVTPLFLGFLPFIFVGVTIDLLRKRKWGEGIITMICLVLMIGYVALIVHLRDRPPPSPAELPVER